MASQSKKLRVVELFAGVGGFRLGLEGWKGRSPISGYKRKMPKNYEVIWSNQWEPSTKVLQHASMVYESKWPKTAHSNEDINNVIDQVPEHDVLVGGFPCQDYSVATTLRNSKGLLGKKGVLWWSIDAIIAKAKKKPRFLILENVDRLLGSPANQRGRDFAVMLHSLNEHGYDVEWRVINAADYGMPQRRRRVFILGYLRQSGRSQIPSNDIHGWLSSKGVLSSEFELEPIGFDLLELIEFKGRWKKLKYVSDNFNIDGKSQKFSNTGAMVNGKVFTVHTAPKREPEMTLGEIVQMTKADGIEIPKDFIIDKKERLSKPMIVTLLDDAGEEYIKILETKFEVWEHLKDSKRLSRKNKTTGYKYKFAEGSMAFPDPLDRPSRTIITGEGGPSPSRFKHVIRDSGKLRRLLPVELERLNMFPADHTYLDDKTTPPTKRAFFMGNALVVGIIERIGKSFISFNHEL